MKRIKMLLEDLYNREFQIANNHFNQTARNNLRNEIIDTLIEDFIDAGLDVARVDKGIALNIENDIEGSINCIIGVSMCSLDYDMEEDAEFYKEKQSKKKKEA